MRVNPQRVRAPSRRILSRSAFFIYPRYRVPWQDVLEARSRTIQAGHGSAIQTRVKVRIAKQNLGWSTGGRAVIEVVRERRK